MPDPNAHTDDMKSPTEYTPPPVNDKDTLPFLWWLNPWNTVLALLHKVDHLKSTSRGEQASRLAANLATERWCEEADRLGKEIKDAKEALGKHALHDGMTVNACGISLVPSIERLVKNYYELNKWNDEFCAERNKALHDLLTTKADLDALKSGEEQALQHANEQLDEARRLATYYRRERDAARDSLTVAKEHIVSMDERMHREQLDHAATLGYVRKTEAQIKRLKAAKAKPAKKKGGSK